MSKKFLFKDHGLFLCVAQKVAREQGEAFYHPANWENGSPTPNKDHVGYGVPGITLIDTFEDFIMEEKPDLLVFPDVGYGGEQERERRLGNKVFGTGRGEVLEDDRVFFRKILEKKKLPFAKYEVINTGIDDLRDKLKKLKDKWIKISMYRGIGETFYHKEYDNNTKQYLAHYETTVGALDKEVDFIIQDPIPAYVKNIGIECFVTDTGYLETVLYGLENKNSAYLGKAVKYSDLPKPLRQVSDAFLPVYKKYNVRGALSMEGHVCEKNLFFFDDPCMRFGSPPGEGICEVYSNLSDIMMNIADGKTIKAEISMPYVAEVMLQIREPGTGQLKIEFPPSQSDNVKIRNLCRIGGQYVHLMEDKEPIIGATVGRGKSYKEAQEQALDIAKKVKGNGVYFDPDGFEDINEQLKRMNKLGWERF